jgi:hypothetical protein
MAGKQSRSAGIGWSAVAASLRRYETLSPAFFQDSISHFDWLEAALPQKSGRSHEAAQPTQ